MEVNSQGLLNQVKILLEKRVKVSGGQTYISSSLNNAMIEAEREAKQMGTNMFP